MAISVNCPSCAKSYQVKDDAAGKKFQCKQCQAIISVPDPSAVGQGDPWDNLDLGADQDPYGEDEGSSAAPPVRRSKKGGARKKGRRGGMPATVIAATVCESILLLFSAVGVVVSVVGMDICGGFSNLIRLGLETGALIGYFKCINVIRWISVALSGLSLLFYLGCGGVLAVGGFAILQQAGMPEEDMNTLQGMMGLLIAALVAGAVLYGAIIGCLLTPSARDYFER